ncbi:MAG TPA: GDSL-type esterase/lipase family protein [Pirellulales bacterium]
MLAKRLCFTVGLCMRLASTAAADDLLPEGWDYVPAMQKVAARFHGRTGVVLHVGDSITYSNPYGQWARVGQGHTEADKAILNWMHTGRDDDSDGWWLCRFDHPDGGRSYTAAGGMRLDELLSGEKGVEALDALLVRYLPQMLVLMIGTNDVSRGRSVAEYQADLERAIQIVLDRGVVLIVSTIPPHHARQQLAQQYNQVIRQLAKKHGLPLIDFEREIVKRRPNDWNGTLLNKDDVHPTAGNDKLNAASTPTEENLRSCGYLLRGWLSVRKIAEVKRRAIDTISRDPAAVGSVARAGQTARRGAALPPAKAAGKGDLRLPVTRDTWLSNVGSEADGSNGGSGQLKVKSIQEMSLVDFDPKPLAGRVVRSATLHLHASGGERLQRMTVGTLAAQWVEGTASGYQPQPGSSTHNHRQHPDVPWSYLGSDLCDVMLSRSGTIWQMADTDPPDGEGWQHVAVDPRVIGARVAGVSYGCLVFDDTGSEWTRDGEKFSLRLYPNRFLHSRESGKQRAPYFTVELGEPDTAAPQPPEELVASSENLPAGEALVTWLTPADDGPAGTIGFFVEIDGRDVPRYLIPAAASPGDRVTMHVRDLELPPGKQARLAVRAVDGAGNRGKPAEIGFKTSATKPADLPELSKSKPSPGGKLPRLGSIEVAIIDALDKVHSETGEMIPPQPKAYLSANHLWSGQQREIRLHAAKNEFVDFQIVLHGEATALEAEVRFDNLPEIERSVGRLQPVASQRGPLPDPVVPLKASAPDASSKTAAYTSLLVELFVPHEAKAGEHRGTLRLRASNDSLELPVKLTVWDFTLPDHLSFLPDMNCYGLPDNERDYYRLAHQHRTVLNRVPYYQNGNVAEGCAPAWDGQRLDWTAWDRRFAQYFDGSAFSDLPRQSVPLECFYLPLQENWPSPIETNYNGSYWADEAFPDGYREAFVSASRQMAEHFGQHGWHDTLFQCFQNGKNNFKENGWSRGSSPWLLDEPANFQDYWALRWFGQAFHEGVSAAGSRAKMLFRCDISRPEWQRDSLDGLLNYNVVGGAFRGYRRIVLDRKRAFGQMVVEYGSANGLEESNVQPAGWSVDAWCLGADGVLPWQTIGTADSWKRADRLALFYPGQSDGPPAPSIRLKSFRRGQQDVEYLTLWCHATGQPRWAVGEAVRRALRLSGSRQGTGFGGEDAGVIQFAALKPADLWALRIALGRALSKRQPVPERRLVEFK